MSISPSSWYSSRIRPYTPPSAWELAVQPIGFYFRVYDVVGIPPRERETLCTYWSLLPPPRAPGVPSESNNSVLAHAIHKLQIYYFRRPRWAD
jgi:hypothetical protein